MPLTPDPNRNMLWARVLVEELERGGVAAAVVSPGSRSAPLAFAFAASRIRLYTSVDERAGGFLALGMARASGAPGAVLCTSGTAAANYLPAVVEASRSRVPLVVVTADRPPELRGTAANQTIDQLHLYGRYPRRFADLPLPDPSDAALRRLRAEVARAVAAAVGAPAGPVHLNVPMRKPLEPTVVAGDVPPDLAADALSGRADGRAWIERPPPAAPAVDARLLDARRGLIVVGPAPAAVGEAAVALARATGWPLLADPLSGARFGNEVALGGYDAFLAAGFDPGAPDLVLRLGGTPTSAALERWAAAHPAAVHVVVDDVDDGDPWHLVRHRVHADPAAWCRAAVQAAKPAADAAWAKAWREAEAAAWRIADQAFAGGFFEGVVAADLAATAPPGALVYASNSMPVRDLDRFARPRATPLLALGNRGASGIDGVTSSGIGAALATGAPTTVLVGDLAFLHDLPGLLALKRSRATVLVVNNRGGTIFRMLPAARFEPQATDLLVTPHDVDLAHAAALAGVPYERVTDRAGLRATLWKEGPRVVEVASDGDASMARREAARRALAAALEA